MIESPTENGLSNDISWSTNPNQFVDSTYQILIVDSVPSARYAERKAKTFALAGFLSAFLESQHSGETWIRKPLYEETLRLLPGLVYPENNQNFLASYSGLFREPGRRLRNFILFHSLCEFVNIHLLLAIDETAEWSTVTKNSLDDFLIDFLPANRLSAILISRADIERGLRGQKRYRYFHLITYTKRRTLPDPSQSEIIEMTKGILATSRSTGENACMKLFPLREDFVLALANLTVRNGHFNTRMFVRGIGTSLRYSLDWERDDVEIGADLVKRQDLLEALAQDLLLEDKKGLQPLNIIEKAEEIQRKVDAARHLSTLLLSGDIDPPTRYMLELAKEVVSELYCVPILSDIEAVAYARKNHRAKLCKKLKQLRETSISSERRSHLKHWIRRKVKTRLN